MYREIMLRNKSIFQISTLIWLSSISICNLLIDLPSYVCVYVFTRARFERFDYHQQLRYWPLSVRINTISSSQKHNRLLKVAVQGIHFMDPPPPLIHTTLPTL
jgi:hypothetical protein